MEPRGKIWNQGGSYGTEREGKGMGPRGESILP